MIAAATARAANPIRPRLELPLLAVVGDKDEVLSSARDLVAAVAGAKLVTLAGEDHQSALAADVFKQAVGRFLQGRQWTRRTVTASG